MSSNKLLFFVDEGGFDDYTPLFARLGFWLILRTLNERRLSLRRKINIKCWWLSLVIIQNLEIESVTLNHCWQR